MMHRHTVKAPKLSIAPVLLNVTLDYSQTACATCATYTKHWLIEEDMLRLMACVLQDYLQHMQRQSKVTALSGVQVIRIESGRKGSNG